MVVGGYVACGDADQESAVVELDILHSLESKCGVAKENVDAEETDKGEVTEVAVQWLGAILATDLSNLLGTLASLLSLKLLVDLGLLHQRVQDVQDRVARPDLGCLGKHVELLLRLVLGVGAPLGKGLELVDKLVEHVPQPLDGEVKRDWSVRVQQVVEQFTDVLIGLETVIDCRLQASINVTEVEFTVEGEENLVVLDEVCNEFGFRPLRRLVVLLLSASITHQ